MAVAIQDNPLDRKSALQRRQEKDDRSVTGRDSIGRGQQVKISPRVEKKSVFDLQRQKIQAQETAGRERAQDALNRRLAVQGLKGGAAARQGRLLDAETRKIEASRKGEVDINELLAAEREAAAESQRKFLTSERIGTQGFTTSERQAKDLTEAEKDKLQMQFITGEREATQLSEAEKAKLAKEFTTSERLGSESFQTGFAKTQGDEAQQFEEFKNKLAAGDILTKTKSAAAYSLGKSGGPMPQLATPEEVAAYHQGSAERLLTKEEGETQQGFAIKLAEKQSELSQGLLSFSKELESQSKLTETKADAAYNLGLSGKPMPTGLSEYEVAAYQSGVSGESAESYKAKLQAMIDYKNALITTLDIDSPDFLAGLNKILVGTGSLTEGDLIEGELLGQTTTEDDTAGTTVVSKKNNTQTLNEKNKDKDHIGPEEIANFDFSKFDKKTKTVTPKTAFLKNLKNPLFNRPKTSFFSNI